ncbi:MAG: FAD-dependent oxidoreductase [Candidatus Brocadiia bacterium]
MTETVTRPEQGDIPLLHEVDVMVVGAGPGGIGAAVAAARQGARTLLCEQYGFPGGMATAGLVNPFMPNGLEGRYFDTGVFMDWCDLMDQMGGLAEDGRTFCHETAKLAAERLLLDAGVELLYHVQLDRPLMDGRRIACALMLGKSGPTAHRADIYVDCTGDADLAARAGCEFEFGRPEDGQAQAMTTCFDMAGVDFERMPDRKTINALYDKAREEGRLECPRENVLFFRTVEPDRIHFNTTRIVRHDATDTLSLSEAEVEGRRQVMGYLRFLRRDVAGFEDARLHAIAVNVGVRESRHVRGHARLTREDFENAVKPPDGICRVNYPIDIHSPTGGGGEMTHMPKGEWYEIPYGCLVPVGCENLLVGGRPISVDHAVHSSMRVMPPACTVGQAAGTAAAMAVRDGVEPSELDGRKVRQSLVEQGVWLEG